MNRSQKLHKLCEGHSTSLAESKGNAEANKLLEAALEDIHIFTRDKIGSDLQAEDVYSFLRGLIKTIRKAQLTL